jgi:hypothetical protein
MFPPGETLPSDNLDGRSYGAFMEMGAPYIRLKLDTSEPIELGEFVGAFTAVAAEYDRFIREERPETDPAATLFVKEVRAGCIEAQLIPWIVGMAGGAGAIGVAVMPFITNANAIAQFVERYGKLLSFYKKKGGKAPEATLTELRDFSDQVAAIANSKNSSLEVAAIEVIDGQKTIKAAFKFDTTEARAIRDHVEEHKRELEQKGDATHQRVLMTFKRSDVDAAKIGKRSGELVRIESVSPRNLPLIYASELAERHIKSEIADGDDNVFKKGFVVDVSAEIRGGKPIAYRVMNVHQVIDLPDDED